jgi:hypothetical protein
MITEHGDPDSSSGGCSTTQLSACLVGMLLTSFETFP